MSRTPMSHWTCDGITEDGPCPAWEDTMGNGRQGLIELKSRHGWTKKNGKHYCLECTKKRQVVWLETYHICGCSSEAPRKQDLLGYCQDHGGSRKELLRVKPGVSMRKVK